jgi:hypothetical protein
MSSEKQLHRDVCIYLKKQYPGIRFKSDMSGEWIGGGKKNFGQTSRIASQRSHKGFPDIQIYERRGPFCSLAIELKAEGSSPFKKDETYKKEYAEGGKRHDQVLWVGHLRALGWYGDFAVGFDEAKVLIDNYLKLKDA